MSEVKMSKNLAVLYAEIEELPKIEKEIHNLENKIIQQENEAELLEKNLLSMHEMSVTNKNILKKLKMLSENVSNAEYYVLEYPKNLKYKKDVLEEKHALVTYKSQNIDFLVKWIEICELTNSPSYYYECRCENCYPRFQ